VEGAHRPPFPDRRKFISRHEAVNSSGIARLSAFRSRLRKRVGDAKARSTPC
jgi:hypothetical protein